MNEFTQERSRIHASFVIRTLLTHHIASDMNEFTQEWSRIHNNYSMSPSWIWSDKITNERLARAGYNHFTSNKGERNNCFSKFSNRVLSPIFISTILKSEKCLNLACYFPYDVKLRLLAHSRTFLANQKARNAIVGAENLLKSNIAFELDMKTGR